MTYLVEWSIDIDADTPEDAAREALTIQRDPNSWATVFHVYGDDGSDEFVDLSGSSDLITKGEPS